MVFWVPDATGGECPAVFTVLRNFIRSESGATAVEYGLLVALIALVVAVAAVTLGQSVSTLFNTTAGSV